MFKDSASYTKFLNQISLTKDDFLEEQKFLFLEIGQCDTVEELNANYDLATKYIRIKLDKYPKFWPREEIKRYINEYRVLYAKVKTKSNKRLEEIVGERPPPSVSDGYKECSKCKHVLELNDFTSSHNSKDGHNNICKECVRIRKENKDDLKHKTCFRCKKRRLKTSYHKNGRTKDKLEDWCKDCVRKAVKGEML